MGNKFTDSELTQLLYEDEEFAFDEIYKRYAHKMYIYAHNVVGKKQACDDMIQNIYLDVWRKRKENKINNLSAYLFRAIKYQIFNYIRSNTISNENLTRLSLIQDSADCNNSLEYEELERKIKNCIDKLPDRCKHIFLLSRFENKTNKEIAKELDISVQGVKNQISKALKIIRKKLSTDRIELT